MNKEIIFNGFSVLYSNITSEVIEILSEKYGFDSNDANEYLMKLNNKTKELCMERIEDINFNFEVNPEKKAKKTTQKVKKEVDPNAPKKKRGRPKKEHKIIVDSSDEEDNKDNKENKENKENNENKENTLTAELIASMV